MRTADFSSMLRYALFTFTLTACVYGQGTFPTKTVLTAGPNPGTAGSNVVFTATVVPQGSTANVPTGIITFSTATESYTAPVMPVSSGPNAGTYAATLILQPATGVYTFTATYGGDSFFAASPASAPVTENVVPGTTTTITVSANPGIYGQPITLTATVNPPTATGAVTFYDLAILVGIAPVVNGTASLTTNLLQSGLRSLTAHYDGDTNDLPSTSSILTVGILSERGLGFAPAATYATAAGSNAVLVADLNGDGVLDSVVVNGATNTISVLLGNPNGTFQNAVTYATGASPAAGVISDFNADGKLDLAVASSDGIDLLFGNGDGTFQPFVNIPIGTAAAGIATTDFNNDGFPDLVASNAGGSSVTVLLGNGAGAFPTSIPCSTGASGTNPVGIGVGDFNVDITPDIAVADDAGITIILGSLTVAADGSTTFSCLAPQAPYTVGFDSPSIEVKDLNGDGVQDIAVTNYSTGTVSVLLGNGDGTFHLKNSYSTDPHPVALASADFNGDGIPDLVVSDGSSTGGMNLFVLLGVGDGSFGTPLGYATDPSLSGVAAAVFVQNGQADVAAVSSSTGNLNILLNGYPTLTITGGAVQSAAVYNTFPSPLTVRATGFGAPAAHIPVTFTAAPNGFFSGVGTTAVVMTDGSGSATAPPYNANGVSGSDNVTATGGGNTVTFALTATAQTCTFTVSPSSLLFAANGGEATFTVTGSASNAPGCSWSASSSYSNILVGNPSGIGNGSVNVLILQNSTQTVLSESLSIAGVTIPVQVQETSQIFADVLPTAYYFDEANLMYEKGITSGCSINPLDYCPTESVTRGQMAVFLVRAVYGGDDFPYSMTPVFSDVPVTNSFFKWIQALDALGITNGCGNNMYCPSSPVTRDQMAVFIIRTRYWPSAEFDFDSSMPFFTDVPPTDPDYSFVQRMKIDNITSGCGPTTYCPTQNVLRQDMAVFIMRGAFNQFLPASEPVISSVSPSTIPSGVPTLVTVTGHNTNFVQGTTVVNNTPFLTAGVPTVTSPTSFTVMLTGTAPATAAPQSIWVTTGVGVQEAVLPNGLTIQ